MLGGDEVPGYRYGLIFAIGRSVRNRRSRLFNLCGAQMSLSSIFCTDDWLFFDILMLRFKEVTYLILLPCF